LENLNLALNYSEQSKKPTIFRTLGLDYFTRINSLHIPNIVLALAKTISNIPFLAPQYKTNKRPFHVYQNQTYLTPNTDFQQIINDSIKRS
jgi:hypothetical protein